MCVAVGRKREVEGSRRRLRADVERMPECEALRRDLDQLVAPALSYLERAVRRAGVDDDDLGLDCLPAQRPERALEELLLILAANDHGRPRSHQLRLSPRLTPSTKPLNSARARPSRGAERPD